MPTRASVGRFLSRAGTLVFFGAAVGLAGDEGDAYWPLAIGSVVVAMFGLSLRSRRDQ
jgi:hypothetical protein